MSKLANIGLGFSCLAFLLIFTSVKNKKMSYIFLVYHVYFSIKLYDKVHQPPTVQLTD